MKTSWNVKDLLNVRSTLLVRWTTLSPPHNFFFSSFHKFWKLFCFCSKTLCTLIWNFEWQFVDEVRVATQTWNSKAWVDQWWDVKPIAFFFSWHLLDPNRLSSTRWIINRKCFCGKRDISLWLTVLLIFILVRLHLLQPPQMVISGFRSNHFSLIQFLHICTILTRLNQNQAISLSTRLSKNISKPDILIWIRLDCVAHTNWRKKRERNFLFKTRTIVCGDMKWRRFIQLIDCRAHFSLSFWWLQHRLLLIAPTKVRIAINMWPGPFAHLPRAEKLNENN